MRSYGKIAGLLGLAILVSACAKKVEERLEGERLSVLLLEPELKADPRIGSLVVTLPTPVRNPGWLQSGGNASHQIDHPALSDSISLAWSVPFGAGSDDERRLMSTPVVESGRIFVADAKGIVSAFDTQSGALLWRYQSETSDESDARFGAGLASNGNRLIVTSSAGSVYALNSANGALVWELPLALPLRSAPTVHDGRVLLLTADNRMFALDQETGSILWQHQGFVESAALLGGPSPAASKDAVIVPYSTGEVFALEPESGRALWVDNFTRPRRTIALAAMNDIESSPVIAGDVVFVAGFGGEMAAVDVRRGIRIWEQKLVSTESPWVSGDYIYVLTDRNELVAIVRQGGRIRWVSPLPRNVDASDTLSETIRWHGPVLAGDRLILTGSNKETLAVSPYDGQILGRIDMPAPAGRPAIVADGTIYIVTDNATLLAYR